jgi:Alpha-L-arabinofuranosidase B (ABFB) domain
VHGALVNHTKTFMYGDIGSGVTSLFESIVTIDGHYIRHGKLHNEATIYAQLAQLDSQRRSDYEFYLLDRGNRHVSLLSANMPHHCLRHKDYRIRLERQNTADDTLWKDDSTFEMKPGLASVGSNAHQLVSFESINYPGHYIHHTDFELWIHQPTDLKSKYEMTFRRHLII